MGEPEEDFGVCAALDALLASPSAANLFKSSIMTPSRAFSCVAWRKTLSMSGFDGDDELDEGQTWARQDHRRSCEHS